MSINRLARNALIASFILVGASGPLYAQSSDKDLAAAVQEVKQVIADMKKPGADRNALLSDKLIDIHGSGWIYDKAGDIAVGKGIQKLAHSKAKVIKSEDSEYQIVAYNRDTVIEEWKSTTYWETPDPEEVSKANGTYFYDQAAIRAASEKMGRPVPGEMAGLNPNRKRTVRVWVRVAGHWQMAASVAAGVIDRGLPGDDGLF
jgi:hypothetical protein